MGDWEVDAPMASTDTPSLPCFSSLEKKKSDHNEKKNQKLSHYFYMISNIDLNQNIDLITDTVGEARMLIPLTCDTFHTGYCKQKTVSSDETICYQIYMRLHI